MLATVCIERLDRFKVSRGNFQMGYVATEQVRAMRRGVLCSLGFDPGALLD